MDPETTSLLLIELFTIHMSVTELTNCTQICFKMRFSYPFSFQKNLNLTFPTGSAILPLAVSVPIETETAREKAHWYL